MRGMLINSVVAYHSMALMMVREATCRCPGIYVEEASSA